MVKTQDTGIYDVIYADPPWKHFNKTFSYLPEYPMLTVDEICELPVSLVAKKDSIIFLWITSCTLPWGLRVLQEWGFRYKQTIIWDKINNNVGYWFNNRFEILLFGIRGRVKPFRCKKSNIYAEKKTRLHSQKPEYFYSLIEEVTPNLKRLELFSRNTRNGWDMWGDELTNLTLEEYVNNKKISK